MSLSLSFLYPHPTYSMSLPSIKRFTDLLYLTSASLTKSYHHWNFLYCFLGSPFQIPQMVV